MTKEISRKPVLEWRDGWLCVRVCSRSSLAPKWIVQWFPVRKVAKETAHEFYPVGEELRESAGYTYVLVSSPLTVFRLIGGGKTKPLAWEEEDIPPPKTRCPVRWRNGFWEKRLKRRGWVLAV